MTAALLREVYRRIYSRHSDAFREGIEEFWQRKGEVKALNWLLGAMEELEAEIVNRRQEEEESE